MKLRILIAVALGALIMFAGYAALFIAPDEATMHAIQRIFYFHLPSWIACFTAFTVVFVANIGWLATRREKYDALAVSAAEVGIMSCTIGLITGPLWAHPVWGIWWTWDARLTTTFILWLLYISYLLLRGLLDEPARRATLSAVFGIFAFLDVPLVYMSNRLWRTQHPQPVILGGKNSGLNPIMAKVLLVCVIAVLAVMVLVLIDRYRLELLRREADGLRLEIESRSAIPAGDSGD
ncbi:MAG TPA: cytochrome c biogenesis protein CcsA [Candidatus Acidoferrum sp.]|nr:cytochrome c biogenesis protein CcsA [Candidatus Acidoferrum sp.]